MPPEPAHAAPPPVNVNIETPPSPPAATEVSLSWASIAQRAIAFGGPAVVILLLGMMIASPRGQAFLFGIEPLDVPALVEKATSAQMTQFRAEIESERRLLRAEIDTERKLAASERAKDRELFDLQFKHVNDALREIKEILLAMGKRR